MFDIYLSNQFNKLFIIITHELVQLFLIVTYIILYLNIYKKN